MVSTADAVSTGITVSTGVDGAMSAGVDGTVSAGVDRAVSADATRAGELHYAIRYNAFMGVRSDFFLAEDAGQEWSTAAARPVPERLRELALAAAADERA